MKELKDKLSQVKNKKILARLMAAHFGKSVGTVYNHWVCGGMTPVSLEKEVLKFVTNYLKLTQNEKSNNVGDTAEW